MSRAPRSLSLPSRLCYRLARQVLTLDVKQLMMLDAQALVSRPAAPAGVTVRLLTETDIRNFAWEPAYEVDAEWATRLLFGFDYCVGAFVDGQLVAYAWYALSSIEAKHNRGRSRFSGTALAFPKHMAFMYKAFVNPANRDAGLFAALHRFALEALKPRGVTAILMTCDEASPRELKSCYRLGFRYLGKIWKFGVGATTGGLYPRAAKRLGIRLGQGVAPVDAAAAA